MKLQNLLIIFVVIALPIIIILSVYVEYQVDTANLRSSYDGKIIGATYDTMLAFQLNTTNNKYSSVADSLVRDIDAAINVFSDSLATNLGMTSANKARVLNYVPALLFTLYDGYYIYTPISLANGELKHELKPYVYYTKEYNLDSETKRMVINFSLDNYVVVYFDDKGAEEYTSKAGYLEVIAKNKNSEGIYIEGDDIYYNGVKIEKDETLTRNEYKYDKIAGTENIIQNFQTHTKNENSTSAYEYYKEAYEFTKWYNEKIKDIFVVTSHDYINLYINENNNPLPDRQSGFNSEKIEVIQSKIVDNLIQAMEMYSRKTTVRFEMPKLKATDWEIILHNACVISFIQGFPVGTATYNNYAIVPSTENEQYINEKNLYYIGYGEEADGSYHRIGCEHLKGERIVRI